jgi:hypothetical protein
MVVEGLSDGRKFIYKSLHWIKTTHDDRNKDKTDTEVDKMPPLMKSVVEYIKKGVHIVMVDGDGISAIKKTYYEDRPPPYAEKSLAVRQVAEIVGLHVGRQRITSHGWPNAHQCRIISTSRELAAMNPDHIVAQAKGHNGKSDEEPVPIKTPGGAVIQMCFVSLVVLAEQMTPL